MNDLKNILYVEDDEHIAEITRMVLQDLGDFSVNYCDSGKMALNYLETHTPDVILLDVMMPEMDGIETFSKIQSSDKKNIPVIFMTAKVQPSECEKYIAMGLAGVISKPYNVVELCKEITRIWSDYNEKR